MPLLTVLAALATTWSSVQMTSAYREASINGDALCGLGPGAPLDLASSPLLGGGMLPMGGGGVRPVVRPLRPHVSEARAQLHLLQLLQRQRTMQVLRRIERQRHRPARMYALDGRSLVQQGCTLWTVGLSSSKDARSGR